MAYLMPGPVYVHVLCRGVQDGMGEARGAGPTHPPLPAEKSDDGCRGADQLMRRAERP
jgi:hypothetical protein